MAPENEVGFGAIGNFECEPFILVTRGDELLKKVYETKLHPTYEVSVRC